ncbi:MAG: CheR family methyltransferase [Cyanobacteria bacterium J06642_2]
MNDIIFESFRQLILQQTGLYIRNEDRASLLRNIEARCQALHLDGLERYYELLNTGTALDSGMLPRADIRRECEWATFVQLLTTGESYFFRDRQQLALLEHSILPALVRQKREEYNPQYPGKPTLKIWSAGCSSGEEAYSIAILIKQLIPDLPDWDFFMLGTDINQSYLEQARAGIYREWSFRQVNPDIKRQYFSPHGKDYEISPDIRQMVTFRGGNLVKDDFPNLANNLFDVDIIICRNVFIYFDNCSIASVLEKFHGTLNETGYLIAGHAELQGQNLTQFIVRSLPGSVVYQKKTEKTMLSAMTVSTATLPAHPPQEFPRASMQVLRSSSSSSSFTSQFTQQYNDSATELPSGKTPTVRQSSAVRGLAVAEELERAIALFQREDYDAARAIAEELVRSQPRQFNAYILLARIHANRGDAAVAVQHCQQALEIAPRSIEALYLLARIAEEKGDIAQAKKHLKKIIYLHPDAVPAYLDLGALYESEGERGRSNKMYATAVELLETRPADEPIEYRERTTAGKLLKWARMRC